MGNRFTEEEDKLILKLVKSSPTNISSALRRAASKLNRSVDSVRVHYYKYLQKNPDNHLFLTISSRRKANNYKITRKGPKATKYNPDNPSKWRQIIEILFG